MKKSCDGCKAFSFIDKYESRCELGYKVDGMKWKPLEQCPKPRTNIELCNLMLSKMRISHEQSNQVQNISHN